MSEDWQSSPQRDQCEINEHTHKWINLEKCFEREVHSVGKTYRGGQEGFPGEVTSELIGKRGKSVHNKGSTGCKGPVVRGSTAHSGN